MCRGGRSSSAISASGDLPTIVDPFINCADDAREGEDLGGVTPPTPCREFIEAFLNKLGVDARPSMLMALGLRGCGLLDGVLPFALGEERFRCAKGRGDCG